jgi:hypothetical protein
MLFIERESLGFFLVYEKSFVILEIEIYDQGKK